MVRINKYLAECGVCSRREADKYIEQGKVTVNGKIAVSGMQISEQDIVKIGAKVIEAKNKKIVLAYYKPVGVTCTEKDVHADKTIIQALNYPVRLTYAGRLDKDSSGLIIMTNDGNLAYELTHPSIKVAKTYIKGIMTNFFADFAQNPNALSKSAVLK